MLKFENWDVKVVADSLNN